MDEHMEEQMKEKMNNQYDQQKFTVLVPATSANCCVGFDCLGLALDWYGRFHFEPADQLIIDGCPKEYCTEDNLVVRAFDLVCKDRGLERPSFHLSIDSDIPFARGLGSSSTCITAGIAAAIRMLNLDLSEKEMLDYATIMEGHPDNAAPAVYGGMNACFMNQDDVIQTKLDCADYHCLAVIPDYEVSTPEARKVLPESLPFTDAVRQTGHALVFEKALGIGDEKLLRLCCEDHLHEPYRKTLIADYENVKEVCDQLEIPFWISGSGPTMLALSMKKEKLEAASRLLSKKAGLNCRLLRISQTGVLFDE